jgi:hypothetical protein
MAPITRNISLALAAGACLSVAGCGAGGVSDQSAANQQTAIALQLAGTMYGEFLARNRGVAPQDAAVVRKYVESRLSDLQANGVKSADDILISPRDGQPFVWATGRILAPPDPLDSPWAVYEAKGVDGRRMIASARGVVVELSQEEFAQRVPGAP